MGVSSIGLDAKHGGSDEEENDSKIFGYEHINMARFDGGTGGVFQRQDGNASTLADIEASAQAAIQSHANAVTLAGTGVDTRAVNNTDSVTGPGSPARHQSKGKMDKAGNIG